MSIRKKIEVMDMRPIHPALKFAIVFSVLVFAFILSTMLAIVVSVNLSVPVQNSNRKLDDWIKSLQNKGYRLYFRDFHSTGSMIKAESITQFETMLRDHEVSEAYWHWTQLAFPYQIVYGKIWFIDGETTYYLETSW